MFVTSTVYKNFRNIKEAELHFTEGVNILWGNNAQGKTNALEGIYCFACGKSFRGVHDKELITFGEPAGAVSLSFRDAQREQRLSLQLFAEKTRKMERNGVSIRKSADFLGTFHGVLFCPEHLSMIKGAPQTRRAFLDAAISQLRPGYLIALTDYARILKQRNAVLKDEEKPVKTRMPLYEVLTDQMAEVNTRITLTRMKYVRLLHEAVRGFLSDMTDERERTELHYQSDAEPEQYNGNAEDITRAFAEKCRAYAQREFAACTTLHGCHRDDILITLNDREARLYASQGQDRSIALAMKLGEGELAKAVTGEYPVFLFDDVLSELDSGRQEYLMRKLDQRQVILTSCNEELFRGMDAHLIHVNDGTYA